MHLIAYPLWGPHTAAYPGDHLYSGVEALRLTIAGGIVTGPYAFMFCLAMFHQVCYGEGFIWGVGMMKMGFGGGLGV